MINLETHKLEFTNKSNHLIACKYAMFDLLKNAFLKSILKIDFLGLFDIKTL